LSATGRRKRGPFGQQKTNGLHPTVTAFLNKQAGFAMFHFPFAIFHVWQHRKFFFDLIALSA
jgi:hypothetical protein